jgi:5-methylcytosine-specific restriction enzyme B
MANSPSMYWQSAGATKILEHLRDEGPSIHRLELKDTLEAELQPTSDHALEALTNDQPRWWNLIAWGSTDLVAAGWMTKDGSGVWTITDAGRQALVDFPDSTELRNRAKKLYQEKYKAKVEQSTQRAWLVRGSSVLGVNMIPQWLDEGWCSLAASQLPPIEIGVDRETLTSLAKTGYEHLKDQEQRDKIAEIVEFVDRMKPGDLVLTSGDGGVFVGDLGDQLEYVSSEGGRSNLRREVLWRNPDAGVDFAVLPGSLQAKLKTNANVADLTAELAAIDRLIGEDEEEDGEEDNKTKRGPHDKFALLSGEVATELFVSDEWLGEAVELLNESRQLVFYGPPGTGKTFLARKIAAHLVGEERVRLVQFHPSYTYEDFFEGFRPAANSNGGGVSLELRPGPLRRLATEAQEHPDRAFVMVIDELNRANIAKVFGELYFLLEYREHGVEVLYGGEPFTLPKNLYFMCTMNTADRSIALLDSAMRRRFSFVELHPSVEPTASMLAEWLDRNGHPPTAARLLSLLNEAIDDRDAHIGPSYFMVDEQTRERLSRIFRTQIEPLLQETHYDRWASVSSKFDFDTLYAKATKEPPSDSE